LLRRPSLLLCDEPTGNLDAGTGREIIRLFQELHREGLTLLAVTHEERISAAAQRVLRLKEGRLQPEGRAGEAAPAEAAL
jgi:putative ABC transport system ATP-binding protein